MRVTCYMELEKGCHVQDDETKVLVIEMCKGNKSDKVKLESLKRKGLHG